MRKITTGKCSICKNPTYCYSRDGLFFCLNCYSERFTKIEGSCFRCSDSVEKDENNNLQILCAKCKKNVDEANSLVVKIEMHFSCVTNQKKYAPKTIYINPKEIHWVNPRSLFSDELPPGYYVKKNDQSEENISSSKDILGESSGYYANIREAGYTSNPFEVESTNLFKPSPSPASSTDYHQYQNVNPGKTIPFITAALLRGKRESEHMTQKQFAKKLGVSQSAISYLEREVRSFSKKMATTIAQYLNK
ncbi:helix-turn-helix domain protein [Solidesulfovibrio carbinoliphilus subsp. oakridgensis]|uniref:Helix-turn-helix domain protein n=2 Tax=Solidesulfovibrio carbinoliphilus TaxID=345370 RepID=G7Q530_9BACT|nr:helix-turn-helix domain protein [Solidesulfovibrio carbinoliphilus subsp. oakridgensis]